MKVEIDEMQKLDEIDGDMNELEIEILKKMPPWDHLLIIEYLKHELIMSQQEEKRLKRKLQKVEF